MNQFIVEPDEDYLARPGEVALQDFVGAILAATYPGYHWRVEAHPHPTRPCFDIHPEEIGAVTVVDTELAPGHVQRQVRSATVGYTIKPWRFYSTSSLKAEIIRGGGTCLEAFNLSRRGFAEIEWLTRKRDHFSGLLILPDGVL